MHVSRQSATPEADVAASRSRLLVRCKEQQTMTTYTPTQTWKWKMVPWKTTFLYKQRVFHFYVSESECTFRTKKKNPQSKLAFHPWFQECMHRLASQKSCLTRLDANSPFGKTGGFDRLSKLLPILGFLSTSEGIAQGIA